MAGWSKNRGQRITLYKCHYGKNQQWLLKDIKGSARKVATKAKKVAKKSYKRVIRKQKVKSYRKKVYIGGSRSNTRCTRVSTYWKYNCPRNCTKSNCRVNSDYRSSNDKFKLTWSNGKVCAKRTDSKGGWGMRLRVKCMATKNKTKVSKKKALKSTRKDVYIGGSRRNVICKRISKNYRLRCPRVCTKSNCRVNGDYRTSNDKFKLTWSVGKLCAKRTDSKGGWGMKLKVKCRSYILRRSKAAAKKVSKGIKKNVYIGGSRGNIRCKKISKSERLRCPSTCTKSNCRVNGDYKNSNDKFRLSWSRGRLCAKRIDSRGGWGMRLKVKCNSYFLGGKVSTRKSMRVVNIENVKARKNIDIWRGKIRYGQKAVIWHKHGNHNQKFRVHRLAHGKFQLVSYKNSKLALGQSGSRAKLMRYNTRDRGQIMRYYGRKKAIINNNGKCLDSDGGRTNAGNGLGFYRCHYQSNQQFRFKTTK